MNSSTARHTKDCPCRDCQHPTAKILTDAYREVRAEFAKHQRAQDNRPRRSRDRNSLIRSMIAACDSLPRTNKRRDPDLIDDVMQRSARRAADAFHHPPAGIKPRVNLPAYDQNLKTWGDKMRAMHRPSA